MCYEKKMQGLQLSTKKHDFSDLPKPYPYTLKNFPQFCLYINVQQRDVNELEG